MKNVVVTGAGGFVGSALVRVLSENGIHVFAVVHGSRDFSTLKEISGVEPVLCDMREVMSLPEIVRHTADTWFHLAWAGATGNARADYRLQLSSVEWAVDAVNAAKQMGCRRFVGIGTLAEMDASVCASKNGSVPRPVSCYGSAKLAAHYISKAECGRVGLEHIWTYLANVYGPGDMTSNFINTTIRTMLSGKPVGFTEALHTYDFVYIDDAAQGIYQAGKAGKANYAYYVGSAEPRPLRTYITEIRDAIDPNIELNFGVMPFNGVVQPDSLFDCRPLMTDTEYMPIISFEDGIRKAIEAIREMQ